MGQGRWARDPGCKEVMGYRISFMVESVQGDSSPSMEAAGQEDRVLSRKVAEKMARGTLH